MVVMKIDYQKKALISKKCIIVKNEQNIVMKIEKKENMDKIVKLK